MSMVLLQQQETFRECSVILDHPDSVLDLTVTMLDVNARFDVKVFLGNNIQ
jgi:hypothetical protein